MADDAPLTGGDGEGLSRKIGPLPLWAWVGIGGALAYLWWTHRSSASSGAAAGSGAFPGGTSGDVGSGGGSSSGGDGTPTPTGGPNPCVDRKDPKGRVHKVCGPGHWYRGPGGLYSWVQGPLKNHRHKAVAHKQVPGGGKGGGRGGGPGTAPPRGGSRDAIKPPPPPRNRSSQNRFFRQRMEGPPRQGSPWPRPYPASAK